MCDTTKVLKAIADQIITKQHAEISKDMTDKDKIEFVNAVTTLSQHSHYLQRSTMFQAG